MEPQADKSNYWSPMVFKVNYDNYTGDLTYSAITGRSRIYYNFPALLNGTGPGTYVEPFPDDFQLVAGSPSKKTGGGYSQEDLSIFYYCEQDYANGTVTSQTTYAMPNVSCSLLVTKIWFPSCWNGEAYNVSNPTAHVQYPLLGDGLLGPNCPLGFKQRIPGLLIETYYLGASSFGDGPAGPWGYNGPDVPTYILSNGDTTGYGLHGDFQNGWNSTVLAQVVTECTDVDFSLPAGESCPPLNSTWNPSAALDCILDPSILIPDELVGYDTPLTSLPGCNLPWGNTTIKPTCPGYIQPRLVNWSTLVGEEDNPTPSSSDLNNPDPSSSAPNTVTSSSSSLVKTVTVTATTTKTTTTTAYTCPASSSTSTSSVSTKPSSSTQTTSVASKSSSSPSSSSSSNPISTSVSTKPTSLSSSTKPSTSATTSSPHTTTQNTSTLSLESGKMGEAAAAAATPESSTSDSMAAASPTADFQSSKRDVDDASMSGKLGRRPKRTVAPDEL
ncbi:MAG: hypothetical protein CYPHOPRED_005048 [Cyphobasidiales sp. Tagirdzhanova-0007]|nr:MAG: hypothetical protein CYPHOPRED_005048 [Cyphobasidiales sp. Tagirdzhanova-0007]